MGGTSRSAFFCKGNFYYGKSLNFEELENEVCACMTMYTAVIRSNFSIALIL